LSCCAFLVFLGSGVYCDRVAVCALAVVWCVVDAGGVLRVWCYCYDEWMKMREDFAQNFGDKRAGCCITTTRRLTLPFSPGNF
jgi:hypothetical protein